MLRNLNLRKSYRSDQHNLITDFYIPCFLNSTFYQRAVGFYSSNSLAAAAKGLHVFLKSGGEMQLIASPYLSKEDIDNIKAGYILRREAEEKSLEIALDGEFELLVEERLNLLARLIEQSRLDVKIAIVNDHKRFGIYHEKLGIFFDGDDFVAFTGSPNESESGLVNNFENIDVFCSWRHEDEERANEKRINFQRLWDDQTKLLTVYPFTEAARRSLLKKRKDAIMDKDPEEYYENDTIIVPKGCPKFPVDIKLRLYQRDAIDRWFNAGGRGIFKMATGSGKTITSLSVVERCYAEHNLQAVIILAPYRHLVTQWSRECSRFGLQPLCCYENRGNWINLLQAKLYGFRSGTQQFLTVITTNSTFSTPAFQSLIDFFPTETMVIGDEAHNLGAGKLLNSLPEKIRKRLALSATPERWFDEIGTEGLFHYFGPVLKEFTLKDALMEKALVPYRYFPLFVNLTDEEAERYVDISRQIARAHGNNTSNPENSHSLGSLLSQRSRLIGAAQNKLPLLRELMADKLNTSHTLFYCGDGIVEEELTQETKRQIEAVSKLLGYDLGYRVDTYTAETPLSEREELRLNFDSGELQGLVAIRCLDEGVDIPSIKTAIILASSSNPRQFIQRRGRVLRKYPGKTEAVIYDMIVLPPEGKEIHLESEKTLLKNEFRRYMEFAELAVNAGEVRGILSEKLERYDMLDI